MCYGIIIAAVVVVCSSAVCWSCSSWFLLWFSCSFSSSLMFMLSCWLMCSLLCRSSLFCFRFFVCRFWDFVGNCVARVLLGNWSFFGGRCYRQLSILFGHVVFGLIFVVAQAVTASVCVLFSVWICMFRSRVYLCLVMSASYHRKKGGVGQWSLKSGMCVRFVAALFHHVRDPHACL